MSEYYALKLEVEFKYELSWCDTAIAKIIEFLDAHNADIKKGMHTEKSVCMIFVCRENPTQLMERLNPLLTKLDAVNNCWCGDCPRNFAALHGRFDPAAVAIEKALRTADFLTESENINKPERREGGI
jgi:hypothetical protein